MSLKKIISILFTGFFVVVDIEAQCAMCKAVIENGDGGMAEGVNNGIVYLMIFPYLLVLALGYALFRYMKKNKK